MDHENERNWRGSNAKHSNTATDGGNDWICQFSAAGGYEVTTSFKIRIKTVEDEQAKEQMTQDYTGDIVRENAHCTKYDVSVLEEWVRTKRMEVTIRVCFHCAAPSAGTYIEYEDNNNTELKKPSESDRGFDWGRRTECVPCLLALCIAAMLVLWVACGCALCLKWRHQRTARAQRKPSLRLFEDSKMVMLPHSPALSAISPMTACSESDDEMEDSSASTVQVQTEYPLI